MGWRFFVTLVTTGLGLTLLLTAAALWAWWYFGWAPFGYAFPSDWLSRQLPEGMVMRAREPSSVSSEQGERGRLTSDPIESTAWVDFSRVRESSDGPAGFDHHIRNS